MNRAKKFISFVDSSARAKMMKLLGKALRYMPNSPAQMKIRAEMDKLRAEYPNAFKEDL